MAKKSGPTSKKPLAVQSAESKFFGCPGGHRLPHRTNNGECTPLYCAQADRGDGKIHKNGRDDVSRVRKARESAIETAVTKAQAKEGFDSIIEETLKCVTDEETREAANLAAHGQKASELAKLGFALGRHAARKAYLAAPKNLKGADAEEWADRKMIELLPDAVAEIEFQLKTGDDKQRMDAAERVLNATGRGKKDNQAGASSPILILMGGQVMNPPWRQGSGASGTTVTVSQGSSTVSVQGAPPSSAQLSPGAGSLSPQGPSSGASEGASGCVPSEGAPT